MSEKPKPKRNILQRVIGFFQDFFSWMREALTDDEVRKALYADLGLNPPDPDNPDAAPPKLDLPETKRIDAYQKNANPDRTAFLTTLEDFRAVLDALKAFINAARISNESVRNDSVRDELVHRLLNMLAFNYVRERWPLLYFIGQPFGFVEETLTSGRLSPESIANFFKARTDNWDWLPDTEEEANDWSNAFFPPLIAAVAVIDHSYLQEKFPERFSLSATYGWDTLIDPPSTTPAADRISERALSFYFRDTSVGDEVDAAIRTTWMLMPEEHGGPGLFLAIGGSGEWETPISDNWKLKLKLGSTNAVSFLIGEKMKLDGPLDAEIGVTLERFQSLRLTDDSISALSEIDGPEAVVKEIQEKLETIKEREFNTEVEFFAVLKSLIGEVSFAQFGTQIRAEARGEVPAPGQASVIPGKTGTRIEVGRVALSGELSLRGGGIKATALDSALVISGGDYDSFIAESLSPQQSAATAEKGTRIAFNLGLGYSNDRGFYIEGGTGLQALIPIGKTLGPVNIQQLLLRLTPTTDPKPARVVMEVLASLGVRLGPVDASIDQLGVQFNLSFPERGGNMLFADLALALKPPNGIGLSIKAGAVTGGGFLFHDAERGQYAGVVHLNLQSGIAVKAFGMLSTRLPGGEKGFSLLVIITVEDFKPIPLGLGFKLTGIGGLLAINRTFDEEVLRAGLKNGTLDNVLFPKDPMRNAPQIISTLSRVFPPAKGHHLFGPVVQLAWGTPTLITMELGVVLEIGERLRLLIVGQVSAVLPSEKNDLIRLHMDALGVIDFDQKTASLDAALYASRFLRKFVLTGGMAMRLRWGSSPTFALSVGGLNKAFTPPDKFPKLERLAINLSASDNPRLRCEAYFAVTSNSVQFGARAELTAKAAGFSIHGEIEFNVLIQFDPFYFLADFSASVQLKRGSTNLFKVEVSGAISGPRPLHVKGKATFGILWWDYSVGFDKTLVEGERPPRLEPVNVLSRLTQALGDTNNWGSQLPNGERQMVTLRERTPPKPEQQQVREVLMHPLSALTIKQSVVPLNRDIAKFGENTPSGPRRFTITKVSVNGDELETKPVSDFFAPAQFLELTDDEKLSGPSFETMDAGVLISTDAVSFSTLDTDIIEVGIKYETFIVDTSKGKARKGEGYELSPDSLNSQAQFGAAARSLVRSTGRAKYQTRKIGATLESPSFAVASPEGQTAQPPKPVALGGAPIATAAAGDKELTYSEARELLRRLKREDPAKAKAMRIVNRFEL
jgi:hypothetical protein